MRTNSVQGPLAVVIIAFHFCNGCGQATDKQEGSSAAVTTSTIPSGKWKGNMKVKETSAPMELTLASKGNAWQATVAFDMGTEQVSNPVLDLKVKGSEISFTTEIGGAQVKFSGRSSDGKILGTMDALKDDKRIDSGTWSLQTEKK
jgi:hypothetical protein